MKDVSLDSVPGWQPEHVSRMKSAWVTSAEQVVALGATDGGMRALAEQLKVSDAEAVRLVDYARNALSPEARAEFDRAADTGNYGLGARKPRVED